MINEDKDKKAEAPKAAPAAPKQPAPTQEELAKSFEELVEKAEASGQRDDPAVARARALLDRQPKKEGKDASSKG